MKHALVGLLVGMHFNPPSKWVTAQLPAGTKLTLRAEPDNPWDENAIQVWLQEPGKALASRKEELTAALVGTSFTIGDIEAMPEVMLGHLAKTDGKPLKAEPDCVGNVEIGEALRADEGRYSATLGFAVSSAPTVIVVFGEEAKAEAEAGTTVGT